MILVSGAVGMLLLALVVSWPRPVEVQPQAAVTAPASTLSPLESQVQAVINTHCVGCHAAQPTDDIFKVAPLGFKLDSWQQIVNGAPKIINRTVTTKDMPLLNKTNMTEQERQLLLEWFNSQ